MKKIILTVVSIIVLAGAGFGGFKYHEKAVHDNKVEAVKFLEQEGKDIGKQRNSIPQDLMQIEESDINMLVKKDQEIINGIKTKKGFQYDDMKAYKKASFAKANADLKTYKYMKKIIHVMNTSGVFALMGMANQDTMDNLTKETDKTQASYDKEKSKVQKQLGL